MAEELTLVVVVGEMDEAIAIDDINGIVTASVNHNKISDKCVLNVCMCLLWARGSVAHM